MDNRNSYQHRGVWNLLALGEWAVGMRVKSSGTGGGVRDSGPL